MKRIFLTSGLVLCLACPAFAVDPDITAPTTEHEHGMVVSNQGDPSCQYPTLEGYNGTSTFTAIWNPIWHTITLEEDDYDATSNPTGVGNPATAANASPSPLYSIQGDANVYQTISGTQGNETFSSPIAANGTVLSTSLPKGRTVNYNLHANVPSGAGTATLPTVTGQEMAFTGFYNTADSSAQNLTQYITALGALTPAGSSAACSATTDSTWYAQYNCATPTWTGGADDESTSEITEHLPTLAGYTFLGWTATDGENDNTYVTPGCITQDTDLYARWQAASFTITYNCNKPGAATTTMAGPSTETQNVTMGGTFTLAAANNCTLPGYTFAGWRCDNLTSTDVFETGSSYYAGGAQGTYDYTGNETCYAQWTPNDIDLVWDVAGGSYVDATETTTFTAGTSCTYDAGITLPTAPTKTGYEFGGWEVVNTPASQQNSNQGSNNEEPTTPTEGD